MKGKILKPLIAFLLAVIGLLSLFSCTSSETATITIKFNSNGGSSVDPIKTQKGSRIDFPAPTRDGFYFEGWFFDEGLTKPVNPNIFTATSNITLYALWKSVDKYPHKITFVENDLGLFDSDYEEAMLNDEVIFTVTPNLGYVIVEEAVKVVSAVYGQISLSKTVTGEALLAEAVQFKFKMPADKVVISAEFDFKLYKIEKIKSEYGEIYIDKQTAIINQTVSIDIVTQPGYKFDFILINGMATTQTSFEMPAYDVKVSAYFQPINTGVTYKVNAVTEGQGNLYLNKTFASEGTFIFGDAVPKEGYCLKSLTVDNNEFDGFFAMPARAVTVKAVFEPIDTLNKYQLSLNDNQSGILSSEAQEYSYGERVNLSYDSDEYELKWILANGLFVDIDRIIMPKDDLIIEAYFVKLEPLYEVKVFTQGEGIAYTDVVAAKEGESVNLIVNPSYLNKLSSVLVNGKPSELTSFIMPKEGLDIIVTFAPISEICGGIEHDIDIIINDYSIFDVNLEYYKALEGDILVFDMIFTEFGVLKDVKINGVTSLDILENGYFIMPNEDVLIEFIVARLYKITAFDTPQGIVVPDKEYAESGQAINIIISPRGGFKQSPIDPTYRSKDGTVSGFIKDSAFIMPNSDIVLEAAFEAFTDTKYNVSFSTSIENGKLTANLTSASEGTNIIILATPDKGYALTKLYYNTLTSYGAIEENQVNTSFIMPKMSITLYAVFTPIEDKSQWSLGMLYDDFDKNARLNLTFTNKLEEIETFLSQMGLSSFSGAVRGLLHFSFRHQFIVMEYSDLKTISGIAQGIYNRYLLENPNLEVLIIGNFIVISFEGYAREDYSIILNGVFKEKEYTLYQRQDGSFGLLFVDSDSSAVILPTNYQQNAITFIHVNAFKEDSLIQTLSLGSVTTLARSCLYSLKYLKYLDLTNVINMDEAELMYCFMLENIHVASYNSVYASFSGVLYYKQTKKLIRYPAAKANTSFTVYSGYTHIAAYAFYGAKGLTKVIFSSVAVIGDYAFKDCENLTFNIDNVNALKDILEFGTGVFEGCYKVTNLNMPNVKKLGYSVFEINNQRLVITLGMTSVSAEGNFVVFKEGGSGSLSIKSPLKAIDMHRTSEAFRAYSIYFTLDSLDGGKKLVLFESNGGSYVNCVVVEKGQLLVKPKNPTRDGFTFEAWYYDAELTVIFDFNEELPQSDILILYAKFVH